MNTLPQISIILMWTIIFIGLRNRKRIDAETIIKKIKKEGNTEMKELAKNFIGKECILDSFDGSQNYEGVIKEVTDGAVLVEKEGKIEALNLDFVICIREYPKNKKGKKKFVITN